MSPVHSEADPSDPGGAEGASSAPPDAVAGRYTRGGLLGAGGMGRVFSAHDERLHRQVAVKLAATPALGERLAHEARITANLEHPGIVAVYDAGHDDGQAWYAMRVIRGRTLSAAIAAAPELAARLALLPHLLAACHAVAYAHAMGIVHRDLKPENIMVGEFGETQVADWGLARPTAAAAPHWARLAPPPAPDPHGGARAGGTPRYMSPEQAAGAPPEPPGDVYALGGALLELLSGHAPPLPGAPAVVLPVDTPPELRAVVARARHPEPGARYPSAMELAADLERWLAGRRVSAYEYAPIELLERLVRAWRAPLTVAMVAGVVLAGVLGVAAHRSATEHATSQTNLAEALTQEARTALGEERSPEAWVLAAGALAIAELPEARGVIAGAEAAGARLLSRSELPPLCRHRAVLRDDGARMACAGEARLEDWELDPLRLRSTLELQSVEAPAWVGERLLVATPDAVVWVRDGVVEATHPGSGWPIAAGADAFVVRGTAVRFLAPGAPPVPFEACSATRATTVTQGDKLLIGCDDGVLRTYGPTGAVAAELTLGGRPDWSTATATADGLAIGGFDGSVWMQPFGAQASGRRLRGSGGSVVALRGVPEVPLVLAQGERGGARVWSPEAGTWGVSLPGAARRMADGGAPGEVLLVGETLERWRLATDVAPRSLAFDAGVSQLALSPDGAAVAVALGTGVVVERRLADGRELRRWAWTDGVAKCVAYGADGRLVAGAMGASGQLLGPGAEVAALPAGGVLRRAGRLADGRVWAVGYAGGALLVDVDGHAETGAVGASPFDGSSSPDGGTAVLLDSRGTVWRLDAGAWREVADVPDASAVDVGNGGTPVVTARRREVCVEGRCASLEADIVDIALHGDLVAAATLTGGVHLLELPELRTVAVLRGHRSRVSSVEFDAAGTRLLSGSWDGTVRIWDLHALRVPAAELREQAAATWGLSLEDVLRGG